MPVSGDTVGMPALPALAIAGAAAAPASGNTTSRSGLRSIAVWIICSCCGTSVGALGDWTWMLATLPLAFSSCLRPPSAAMTKGLVNGTQTTCTFQPDVRAGFQLVQADFS